MGKFDKLNQELVRVNNAQGGPNAAALDDRFQLLNNTLVNTQQEWEDYVARRQQEQEALDEYSHGRGNRSYLREGMADGSYQAGMAAAKDQRTTAQKRIDKLLGVDSSQVTGEKTDWGKIAKGAWYKGADQFSTSMVGGLNWLFGDAAEQIHSLGIETINGIIGGVNSLTGANIKPVENKGNLLTNWYETLKETKAHNEKVFAANANSSKAAQIVDNFGTSFVAAVPMALEALMTAPYAAAKAGATATTAGLQYVSGLQAAKGMEAAGMMARQSASTLMQNPQFWSSYVQAIGDSTENAEESGMSPRDAAIYTMINSFFNAAIEVGGADETLGGIQNFPMRLRQLEEQGGKKAVVEWFKDSVLGEGLEEVAQGIFERGVKAPATGAKVASLDPGDTDAIFNPWTSAQEFTGGAVVGGLLGGGQTVIQGGAQKVSDNRAFKGDAQTLLDSAKQSGGEQYAAQIREIEQAAKGKDGSVKLNRGQARQLYDIIESSGAAEQYRETVNQKATAQSAEGLVSSVFADGDIELTDQQRGRIMETMSEGSAGIADFAMGTREAYEMGERGATMEETVQAMGEKYGLTPKQARTAWGFGASENSTAESTVRARTSARERAQSVGSWATVQEYAVSQFGEHADRIVEIHGMNPKQNLQEFTRGMDEVSSLGRVNPNQEDAIEYGARYGLTEEQSAAAWQLGRDQSAKERTEAPAEAIKATARIRVSKNGRGTVRGLASSEDGAAPAAADKSKNGRVIGENVRFSELNDAQKAAVRLFRMFAEATGINFRLTNETRDDGRTVTTANGETRHVFSGSQGEFSRTNAPDEITVDIGAGLYFTEDAETEEHYTMLRTLGHELVHFIQAWSPAQYAELRDSVFRYVRENGTSGKSVNDRIDEVRSRHPEWSYERASDEVVAEALSEALPESQFAEQLARENKGLAEKIREALRDFIRDLKAAFARYVKRVGHVSDDLREQYKGELRYAESILKVYDNALSSAVRNYQDATEGAKTAQEASEGEGAETGAETGEESKRTLEAAEGGTEVKNSVEQRQAALNERIRGAEEAEANALPLEETAAAPEETEATQESDREDARETASGYDRAEEDSQTALENVFRDISSVDDQKAEELLEFAEYGEYDDGTYLPMRSDTPQALVRSTEAYHPKISSHPLLIPVSKARQAMTPEGEYYKRGKGHGMSRDQIVSAIRNLDTPAHLIYEKENQRYAALVKYKGGRGKLALIPLDLDNRKNPDVMNRYPGGTYNIAITVFTQEDVQSYLEKSDHAEIPIKRDGAPRGSYGSSVPSLSNGSPSETKVTEKGYAVKGKTARWTQDRIDALYKEYAATSQNYSKAYAAYISPADFLSLTTRNLAAIEADSRELNAGELRDYRQEIFLAYDPAEPGIVAGHEGRHRMVALRDAGIERVPIAVQFWGEEGKQNRQPLPSLHITGQEFSAGFAPGDVTLADLVPISRAYRAEIEEKFGANGEEDVQFSDREDARGYTNAELLELAADEIKTGDMNEAEKYALDTFKKHLGQLNALRAERTAALSVWQSLRDAGDTQKDAAKAARNKLDTLNGKIRAEREAIAKVSEAKPLERALKQARKLVEEGDRAEARERIANYRDGKRRSTMRQKIRAVRDTLDAILRHPKKGNSLHVPPELVRAVSEVCSLYAENRRSTYTARAEKYGKAAESAEAGSAAEAEARASEARASAQGEKLDVLIAAYEALQKSDKYSATFSPTVLKILETLRSELRGTEIQNMTLDQLTEVYNAMTALKKTVIEANKAYSINRQKSITETANQTKSEILNTPVTDKKLRVFIRRVGLWQMRPDTFFSAICGYAKDNGGEAIQRGFTEGTERSLTIQRDFYNLMRPVLETESASERQELKQLITNPTAKKNLVKWGLRDRNGDEVLTTRGMMLQAYKLMKQEDSRRSLALGGFSLPDLQTYYSGKTTDAYGDRDLGKMRTETVFEAYSNLLHEAKQIKTEAKAETSTEAKAEAERESKRLLQEADTLLKSAETKVNDMMKQIERQLTPFEKKLLELAEKWYEYSGKKMDEVFFEMYGYHLPRVENYTAIHRDTTTIGLDVRGFDFDEINLENSGFVKERVKSNAPILLTDIFNELQTSAVKVGRYYGYALVQRDFNKIYRAKLPGGYSLEEVVASRWGVGGKNIPSGAQWIKNYIGAVSGANNSDGSILDFLYGAGASSSLSLNLRVAVSQLASIPTAAGVIGWKDMAAGFPGGLKTALTAKGRTELAQKSVWFWQRYRGSGGLTEIADFKSGTGMGPVGRLWGRVAQSRAGKYLFNWCQAMDVLATGSMWSMAERHVQSQGLTPQSESYEQAVADCYRDIIRKTQPNYTETERSDILRDRRTGMKFLTMYKTQSNQNLNILMEANGRLRKYSQDYKAHRGGVTAKDLAEARTAFVNSFTAVLLGGSVSFALFRTAVNFILGTLKKYRDEDDELTAESVLLGILDETLSSMAGMFAFGNIVYDAVSAIVTGGRFYGLSDSAFETLGNALTSGVSAIQKLFDEDADAESKAKAIAKALMSGLQLFGAPINNASKIADAGKMWYTDLANGTFGQFEGNVEHSKTDEYRRIIRATREGDSEKAARIIASLLLESEAVTDREAEKEMQSGIRAQLKKMFLANDSELTAEEAESLLAALCGHRKREAQEMVTEWRGKAETGYTYDEIREAYVAGSVEESTVREYMTTYKGFSASKADETMQKMRCQKETGYKYDDLKDAFLDEKITASQARSWLMHYGGRSTESAADTVSDWTAESRYGYSSSNWRDAFDGKERDSDTLDALMQSYGSTWMHDAYAGLRAYGMAPKNCYDTLEGMDTSQNGSITQSECYQYLTANYSYAEAVRIWDVMARAKNWQSKGNFRTFQWAGEQWLKEWQFQ